MAASDSTRVYGVLGEFEHAGSLLKAAGGVRDSGFKKFAWAAVAAIVAAAVIAFLALEPSGGWFSEAHEWSGAAIAVVAQADSKPAKEEEAVVLSPTPTPVPTRMPQEIPTAIPAKAPSIPTALPALPEAVVAERAVRPTSPSLDARAGLPS